MWDFLPIEELIKAANAGNYGLAKQKWTEQLAQIRALPEPPRADEEAKG